MPRQPQTFRPAKATTPTHRPKEADRQRTRALHTGTKAWRLLREAVLVRDGYQCRACRKVVVGRKAHVDHIHNDAATNAGTLDTLQTLCVECHGLKTATEQSTGKAHTHPDWLPMPACRVVLVSGPPGSGKTTYAKQHAGPSDVVIDLDDCFTLVCGTHGHDADSKHLAAALRVRNKMIANLASKRDGAAYLVIGAPNETEVQWWRDKLGAESVRLMVTQAECEARLAPHRRHLARGWYIKATQAWRPPSERFGRS